MDEDSDFEEEDGYKELVEQDKEDGIQVEELDDNDDVQVRDHVDFRFARWTHLLAVASWARVGVLVLRHLYPVAAAVGARRRGVHGAARRGGASADCFARR
jgi:hypothetical protein